MRDVRDDARQGRETLGMRDVDDQGGERRQGRWKSRTKDVRHE